MAKYTSGKWFLDQNLHIYAKVEPEKAETPTLQPCVASANHVEGQSYGNAKLIVEAVNAFQAAAQKLGMDAIELAETMQDGDIADMLMACEAGVSDRKEIQNLKDEVLELRTKLRHERRHSIRLIEALEDVVERCEKSPTLSGSGFLDHYGKQWRAIIAEATRAHEKAA